jgi:hypothetical protein
MRMESPRCFFSYSREDSEFVLRLARELRKAGANLWLDRLDIRGGQRWDEAVQAALQSCPGLLAVLSPSAVASQNFMDEVSYALEEQKQVIPVLYQQCAIPFRLRRVQYVDFSSGYDEGFAELLRALGLEPPAENAAPSTTEGRVPEEAAQPAPQEEGRRDESIAAERTAEQGAEQEVQREPEQNRAQEKPEMVATEPAVSSAKPRLGFFRQRWKGALVGAICGALLGFLFVANSPGGAWSALLLSILGAFAGASHGDSHRSSG